MNLWDFEKELNTRLLRNFNLQSIWEEGVRMGFLDLFFKKDKKEEIKNPTPNVIKYRPVTKRIENHILTRFIHGYSIEEFSSSYLPGAYAEIMDDDAVDTVRNLIEAGLLEQGTPNQIIDEDRTCDYLKSELRKKGLPLSGKKSELINRLLQAEQDYEKFIDRKGIQFFPSDAGKKRIDIFFETEKKKHIRAIENCLEAIHSKNYFEACTVICRYRNGKILSDVMAVSSEDDNKRYKLKPKDFVQTVQLIFSIAPVVLDHFPCDLLQRAREIAALSYLFGSSYKEYMTKEELEFTASDGRDLATASNIFRARAQSIVSIERYRNIGISKYVEISGQNPCPNCARICKKYNLLGKVPYLPNDNCQNIKPCPLSYI